MDRPDVSRLLRQCIVRHRLGSKDVERWYELVSQGTRSIDVVLQSYESHYIGTDEMCQQLSMLLTKYFGLVLTCIPSKRLRDDIKLEDFHIDVTIKKQKT